MITHSKNVLYGTCTVNLGEKHTRIGIVNELPFTSNYNPSLTPEHNRTRQYPAELLLLVLLSSRLKLLLDEGLYAKKDWKAIRVRHAPSIFRDY